MRTILVALAGVAACGSAADPIANRTATLVRGAVDPGGQELELAFENGRFVDPGSVIGRARIVDASGLVAVPGFIDSHVHLEYWPVAGQLRCSGIDTAVDLAAPMQSLGQLPSVIGSGPMLTGPRGYPTQSWGPGGYGLECPSSQCVTDAVERLADRGARVIKVAVAGERGLAPDQLLAASEAAAARDLPVVAHALDGSSVTAAVRAGIEILAHTPITPLDEEALRAASGMTVISTLAAFESPHAVSNLRALREAGSTVVYGTDLGNLREAGISRRELELMRAAGLSDDELIAAATTAPASLWKLRDPAALESGARASFLLIDGSRSLTESLSTPESVYLDGRLQRCR